MRIPIFIFVYSTVVSVGKCTDADEKVIEKKIKKIYETMSIVHTTTVPGYEVVTRHIATNISKFKNYRSVSAIFFPMPSDVTEARFIFEAEEIQFNSIGRCKARDVIIHLKRGSYPAVNPDGYSFPSKYMNPDIRAEKIHTIEMESNSGNKTYFIDNPKPGNWYALVYVRWEDPKTSVVEQDGLVSACTTILYTDLQVKRKTNITLSDCNSQFDIDYNDVPRLYKCIPSTEPKPVKFNVLISNVPTSSEPLLVRIQALNLPTDKEHLISCHFYPNASKFETVTFNPYPNKWHYIEITKLQDNASLHANCESYAMLELDGVTNYTVETLMRDNKGRFFKFEYGLPKPEMEDATSYITLHSGTVKTVKFEVENFFDIGGNMEIEISLLMNAKYYMGYKRPLKKGSLYAFEENDQFFKVVVCMNIDHASLPLASGHCQHNDRVRPALFSFNSTDAESIYDKVIIPFPESGSWYLSLRLFCDDIVCPCPISDNGKYYVGSNMVDKEENMSGELTNKTKLGESKCNTSLLLSISSDRCTKSHCMNEGKCELNAFSGLLMSYCWCADGYGGWDCSDDSRMDSLLLLLMEVLLLTLSNLMFILPIYVAIIRLHYTEAAMYTFTMFASTFYHACDAYVPVKFCITNIEILQYVDFYCGNMAFWVTLLAMSGISNVLRSILLLSGALVIAILTAVDMYSVVLFLVPVVTGSTIMFASWAWLFYKTRQLLFKKVYYTRFFPLGLAIVGVGLVCYAFFQTESNYKYVHSLWHMLIAISIVFLLPDCKRDGYVHPFKPTPNLYKLPNIRKIFQRRRIE